MWLACTPHQTTTNSLNCILIWWCIKYSFEITFVVCTEERVKFLSAKILLYAKVCTKCNCNWHYFLLTAVVLSVIGTGTATISYHFKEKSRTNAHIIEATHLFDQLTDGMMHLFCLTVQNPVLFFLDNFFLIISSYLILCPIRLKYLYGLDETRWKEWEVDWQSFISSSHIRETTRQAKIFYNMS